MINSLYELNMYDLWNEMRLMLTVKTSFKYLGEQSLYNHFDT